jgi:hypothetical protein
MNVAHDGSHTTVTSFIWQNVLKLQDKMQEFHFYMELLKQIIGKGYLVEKWTSARQLALPVVVDTA